MSNHDSLLHVRGASRFVDDLPMPARVLHACVLGSPLASGMLRTLEVEEASALPGVVAVLTAKDIPGENQIGGIQADEPALADGEVEYVGQPLALVLAETQALALDARDAIRVTIEPVPPVLDPRDAHARGRWIVPPKTFALGDVDSVWSQCAHVLTGRVDSGGQEHLYLETQAALVEPTEAGLRVWSSTQAPTAVQRAIARVVGLPHHAVEVEVPRLGGGFGGKEDQATLWAVLAALGAQRSGRPVRLVLSRHDDLIMTGKRHPYSADFRIGCTEDGRVLAYEVMFYQNGGAAADLSPAILDRTLFHATNTYFIPHVRAVAASCRTNLVPFTAFRGFGGPQGMFVIEAALCRVAEAVGKPVHDIQALNLLRDGDVFPYGQQVHACRARPCFHDAENRFDAEGWRREVDAFNRSHLTVKRGWAAMPICFGISFTTTFMNQASALVHIGLDGSVGIGTAAVEMGQGVNEKLRHLAACRLGISDAKVRILPTNTTRNANTPPTAASKDADLNGFAVLKACGELRDRLVVVARDLLSVDPSVPLDLRDGMVVCDGTVTPLTFPELVVAAHRRRVSLSVLMHHATPNIHFDPATNTGHPFAYHVYGTAFVEAEVDGLRGTGRIRRVAVVHDAGLPLDPVVDRGQCEGGIVQGIGWATMEETVWNDAGRLLSDTLSSYKVPDLHSIPERLDLHFLDNAPNEAGPLMSKAIGEPPFLYGIGAYFALLEAIRAFRPDLPMFFTLPMTAERILMALTADREA